MHCELKTRSTCQYTCLYWWVTSSTSDMPTYMSVLMGFFINQWHANRHVCTGGCLHQPVTCQQTCLYWWMSSSTSDMWTDMSVLMDVFINQWHVNRHVYTDGCLYQSSDMPTDMAIIVDIFINQWHGNWYLWLKMSSSISNMIIVHYTLLTCSSVIRSLCDQTSISMGNITWHSDNSAASTVSGYLECCTLLCGMS